jgi:Family of unknown function (DUF6765)
MDVEFHYYMTYLVAAKAGFGPSDAGTIAYACQHVDDNDMVFEIDKGKETAFHNYISQTMNILKPKAKLMRIYMCFHFIPGEPLAKTAERRDGRMHWLNTTPGSKNAELIFRESLVSNDLYRVGIACHGYADSWAHQNFVGYLEDFNALKGVLEDAIPSIGHADALTHPDWPALVWQDRRLLGKSERVDNRVRFLSAAASMFGRLRMYADPRCSEKTLARDRKAITAAFDKAIGVGDQANEFRDQRVARYLELTTTKEFGGKELPRYDADAWLESAVDIKVRLFRDRTDSSLARWDPFTDRYSWRDPKGFSKTDWYRFQVAVKDHQRVALDILAAGTGKHVELDPATL